MTAAAAAPDPREHRCWFCKARHASYGFTYPGRRRDLPAAKRDKYLWTCEPCRPLGEEKRAAFVEAARPAACPGRDPGTPSPEPQPAAPRRAPDPIRGQGRLF